MTTARAVTEGPQLPEDITADELDPQIKAELVALARPVADIVARHLVAAGRFLDEDAELSLEHAVAARRLASRIAVVREAVGLAAYKAGQWQTAVAELRTYQRMSGKQTHLAVLADCERALGRPERAVDLYRSAERREGNSAEAIELLIVAAGARADMGQKDAAVAMLQVKELTSDVAWAGRLRYAFADALLDVGRRDEAREWFARAAAADPEGETDAAERLLELDGITLEEDDDGDDLDSVHDGPDEEAESERDGVAPADGAAIGADEDLDASDQDVDADEFDDDAASDADADEFADDADDADDDDDDEDDDWELYEPASPDSPPSQQLVDSQQLVEEPKA